jgi:hypothetical protein
MRLGDLGIEALNERRAGSAPQRYSDNLDYEQANHQPDHPGN